VLKCTYAHTHLEVCTCWCLCVHVLTWKCARAQPSRAHAEPEMHEHLTSKIPSWTGNAGLPRSKYPQFSFPETANSNPIFEIQSTVAPLCSPLTFFLAEQIWWLEYFPWTCKKKKKKKYYPRSRRQYRTHAELSFEMGSTLSLQGLCKIPLSQLTVPIERFDDWKFPLGDKQKKICWSA